jgi:hypothetical protein
VAISFNGVLILAAVAVAVPVVLGLLPAVPVPGAVLEVIAGIVIGPSVFPGLALRLLAGKAPLPEPVRLEDTGLWPAGAGGRRAGRPQLAGS